MSNPWLAIDVATAPAERAREIRRAWERFVGGRWDKPAKRGEGATLRVPIEESWRRSAAAGVDPSGVRIAPIVADEDEASARWEMHPLAETAALIRSCLAASADESQNLIVVSDSNGILLWVEGNPAVRLRAAESMNFAEGTLWSEGGAGTNAIGTALAAEHAVQVFAAEHFNEMVQSWTCAAAPVHDPDTGHVIGVIDLTGQMATVHPHSMAVATATAQAVEAHLRCEMLNRDGRLLNRYGDQLSAGHGPRALISPSGRLIASEPMGWLPGSRLNLPPGGGELTLAPGVVAIAEALGAEEAYLVRATPVAAHHGSPVPM
ncbi:MAG: GAF domain-containing protein, partial [Solirubrobacteraceae bacterium]